MRLGSRKNKEDPEINLIPLIDIALLLVIFFMLSSTFMQEGRMKIELPQAAAPIARKVLDRYLLGSTEPGAAQVVPGSDDEGD